MGYVKGLIEKFLIDLKEGKDVEASIIEIRAKKFQLIKNAAEGRGIKSLADELDEEHRGEVLRDKESDLRELCNVLKEIAELNRALLKLFEREIAFTEREIQALRTASQKLGKEITSLVSFYERNKNRIGFSSRDRNLMEKAASLKKEDEAEIAELMGAVAAIQKIDGLFARFKKFIEEQAASTQIALHSAESLFDALVKEKKEHAADLRIIKEGTVRFLTAFRSELQFYTELSADAAARSKILGELVREEEIRENTEESMKVAAGKGKLRVLVIPCNWGFGPVSKAVSIVKSLKSMENVLDEVAIMANDDICRAAKRGFPRIKKYVLSENQIYDKSNSVSYAAFQAKVSNFIAYFYRVVAEFKPNLVIDSLGYLGCPLAKQIGIPVIKLDHLFPELTKDEKGQTRGVNLLQAYTNKEPKFRQLLVQQANISAFQWLGDVAADYLIVPAFYDIAITPSVIRYRGNKNIFFVNPSMDREARKLMDDIFGVKERIMGILPRFSSLKMKRNQRFTKIVLVNTGGGFYGEDFKENIFNLFVSQISALIASIVSLNERYASERKEYSIGVVVVGSLGTSKKFYGHGHIQRNWSEQMRNCLIFTGNLRPNNVIRLYLSADLIVTNPGQTSISELITLNRPFLLLPPYQTEMIRNFDFIIKNGCGLALARYIATDGNPTASFVDMLADLMNPNSKVNIGIRKRQQAIFQSMQDIDDILASIISDITVRTIPRIRKMPQEINEPKETEKKSTTELISIVIPCYNSSSYLGTLIESILAQTYNNFEVIIVDDGSTEIQASENFAKLKVKYPFVTIIRYKENKNANYARNKGFEASKGKYLFFCDSDTILYPSCFEDLKNELDRNRDCSFAYCNFDREPAEQGLEKHRTIAHTSQSFDIITLREKNYISTISLIKREVFPGFDPFIHRHQDWDLFLTISESGHKGIWINKSLFKSVERKGSISGRGQTDRLNSQHIILSKHGIFSLRAGAKYAIILPTYNQEDKTIRCLQSLKINTPVNYHLFWVDDDSNSESYRKVADALASLNVPHTKISKNGKDKGFIGSVNLALEYIKKDQSFTHIAILNNDIVLTRGWIDKLLYPMLNDKLIVATGPVTSKSAWQTPKGVEMVCRVSLQPYTLSDKEDDIENYSMGLARNVKERFRHITVVSFFCTLFNRQIFDKIGGLDPRYGMGYADDDDFCLRILKAGYRIAVCLDTFVYHDHGASFSATGKRNELITQNHRLFEEKWGHKPQPARLVQY